MMITALLRRPGHWQLLRDVSAHYVRNLERQGWTLVETWVHAPSIRTVVRSAR